MTDHVEAAVVGGGPAGLQAALTLGRMQVSTAVFDDARYRNQTSHQMNNVLGWDATSAERLRRAAHRELAAYPHVRLVRDRVLSLAAVVAPRDDKTRSAGGAWELLTRHSRWVAHHVLLASGVHDQLLAIPGLRELWGDLVLPCPYCHAHEFTPGPIAVISEGSHAEHVAGLLRAFSGDVPVLAPQEVAVVARSQSGVDITLVDGTSVSARCVFIPPRPAPRHELVQALGVDCGPGGVVVDALGRTSQAGVWAAGDVAQRLDPRIPAAVVTAMALGLTAAADIAASAAHRR